MIRLATLINCLLIVGWSAFVLALIAVSASALGVIEGQWVDGDEMLFYAAMVSALLTAILAHTRLRAHWAAVICGGSGLIYVDDISFGRPAPVE